MVELARRMFVRPKIDEECPTWARALIPFSEQEHGLGISRDKIPQATLEELEYFFPLPEPPKRQRRIGVKPLGNKYARTCGLTVFLACLPFALAKQLDLFTETPGEGTGEVAVLGFRKLADFAKSVGMSYDRVQRWMTILVTLGFIWRFRDGRRTLYVMPLTAYAPRPSVEGVRTKLTALIHSQCVEIEQVDGKVMRVDRCPEFTSLLLETRARFELRYQLAPSLDLGLVEDVAWENVFGEIQKVLPSLTRTDLYTILPIVARHLLQQNGKGKDRHLVLKHKAIESTFSIGTTTGLDQVASTQDSQKKLGRTQSGRRGCKCGTIESTLDSDQTEYRTNFRGVVTPAHSQEPDSSQIRDKSRFNGEDTTSISGLHGPSEAALGLSSHHASDETNLHLPVIGTSLTCTPELEQKEAKERWCQEQGEELVRIFGDQKSLDFYVGVHRVTQDPLLLRAIFIKTIYQEQHGGFRQTIGAYFNFMWKTIWGPFRTYNAACAKWQKWGNKRDPKGIPPNIQELVTLYEHDSYSQIAINMGHQWPEAEQTALLKTPSNEEVPRLAMLLEEAEALVEALHGYASWYLRDPQISQEFVDVPDGFVVDALWPDGKEAVFATFDEWLSIHQQMLTLPKEIASWYETERIAQEQRVSGKDDDIKMQEKDGFVLVALAMYSYYGKDATALSWEDLVTLGRPLLGKRVEPIIEDAVQEEPGNLVTEGEHLYVYLDDGDRVPFDDYQRSYAFCEEEQVREEGKCTYEGELVALKCEQLLGFALGILRTCGLPVYRMLFLRWKDQIESEVPSEEGVSNTSFEAIEPDENQAANRELGMSFAVAWQYQQRLKSALEPSFYQIRWRPSGEGTYCIAVVSQLSGKTYLYDCVNQVEQVLAELSVSAAEEAYQN